MFEFWKGVAGIHRWKVRNIHSHIRDALPRWVSKSWTIKKYRDYGSTYFTHLFRAPCWNGHGDVFSFWNWPEVNFSGILPRLEELNDTAADQIVLGVLRVHWDFLLGSLDGRWPFWGKDHGNGLSRQHLIRFGLLMFVYMCIWCFFILTVLVYHHGFVCMVARGYQFGVSPTYFLLGTRTASTIWSGCFHQSSEGARDLGSDMCHHFTFRHPTLIRTVCQSVVACLNSNQK